MLSLGVGRLPRKHSVTNSSLTRPGLTEAVLCLHKLTSVNAWPHQIRFLGEAEIACLDQSIDQPLAHFFHVLVPSPVVVPASEASDHVARSLLSLLTGYLFCKMFKHFLDGVLASGWLKVSRIGFLRLKKDVLSLKVQPHTMLH